MALALGAARRDLRAKGWRIADASSDAEEAEDISRRSHSNTISHDNSTLLASRGAVSAAVIALPTRSSTAPTFAELLLAVEEASLAAAAHASERTEHSDDVLSASATFHPNSSAVALALVDDSGTVAYYRVSQGLPDPR